MKNGKLSIIAVVVSIMLFFSCSKMPEKTAYEYLELATEAYESGDIEKGDKYLEKALELNPNIYEEVTEKENIASEKLYFEMRDKALGKFIAKSQQEMTEVLTLLNSGGLNHSLLGMEIIYYKDRKRGNDNDSDSKTKSEIDQEVKDFIQVANYFDKNENDLAKQEMKDWSYIKLKRFTIYTDLHLSESSATDNFAEFEEDLNKGLRLVRAIGGEILNVNSSIEYQNMLYRAESDFERVITPFALEIKSKYDKSAYNLIEENLKNELELLIIYMTILYYA